MRLRRTTPKRSLSINEAKEALDAIAHVGQILSLGDLVNRGTKFHIQKIDIEAGKATVQANARIEQFPSAWIIFADCIYKHSGIYSKSFIR